MKWILLMIGLMLLMGTATATDYYVKPTGDNSSDGLTIGTAWASTEGWLAGSNIFVGHAVEINTNGDVTQKGSPDQNSVNLTGIFNVVVS